MKLLGYDKNHFLSKLQCFLNRTRRAFTFTICIFQSHNVTHMYVCTDNFDDTSGNVKFTCLIGRGILIGLHSLILIG